MSLIFSLLAGVIFGAGLTLSDMVNPDLPIVGGAGLFGVGWGLAGICPGPALVDLVTLEPKVLLFGAAMLFGMIVASAWRDRVSARKALRQPQKLQT
jgi:uncharacterized membrane protein YedE/YeeE